MNTQTITRPSVPRGTEVEKVVTLTTEHLPPTDYATLADRLTRDEEDFGHPVFSSAFPGGFAIPMNCGWLLRFYSEEPEDAAGEVGDEWAESGYTRAFRDFVRFWLVRGVRYIRFDRDAEPVEALPIFDQD